MLKKSTLGVTLGLLVSVTAAALTVPFLNLSEIANRVGFTAYGQVKATHKVKIAILDNGFHGVDAEIGRTLPAQTVYHAGPVAVDPNAEENHGLVMAQMVAGLLGFAPGISYELHLFSAFGYSNLEAAVNQVVAENFDVVLYSQVWEYGGNGDGRGFINTVVNRATAKGIIWINAAGNFAVDTYRTSIAIGHDDWVRLPGPNDTVRIRCKDSKEGSCPLRAVLSWNDFKDDVKIGTDKDLDLIVTDDTLRIVASSALTQMLVIPAGAAPGASLYPREIVQTELKPGQYFLRVKARSRNFDKARDQIRLTVSGANVELLDKTQSETILPPADNAQVITIGASDSEKSGTSISLNKPELFTPSLIALNNQEQYKGSSNSAAIAAAAVVVMKALDSNLDRRQLVSFLTGAQSQNAPGTGIPLQTLGFYPTSSTGCFIPGVVPYTSPAIVNQVQWLSSQGAIVVQSTRGLKIFTAQDPFAMLGRSRYAMDDMLILNANGYLVQPRANQNFLPPGNYEVVQQPLGQVICQAQPTPGPRHNLKLPLGTILKK